MMGVILRKPLFNCLGLAWAVAGTRDGAHVGRVTAVM